MKTQPIKMCGMQPKPCSEKRNLQHSVLILEKKKEISSQWPEFLPSETRKRTKPNQAAWNGEKN